MRVLASHCKYAQAACTGCPFPTRRILRPTPALTELSTGVLTNQELHQGLVVFLMMVLERALKHGSQRKTVQPGMPPDFLQMRFADLRGEIEEPQ